MAADRAALPVLNDAQLEVLRWIAEGCPAGRYDGYAHRVSAAALKSRDLVLIHGRGPSWHAELTDTGRQLLANPPVPPERHKRTPRSHKPPKPQAAAAQIIAKEPRARKPLKTEQLVADLLATEDGVLRLPLRLGRNGPSARQRAYAAQAAGKLPEGKALATRVIGNELEIRLHDTEPRDPDQPAPQPVEAIKAQPVPVPDAVQDLHRVARRFRDASQRHEVSEQMLPRTVRLVHAIATEAERRGWKVQAETGPKKTRYMRATTAVRDGHVTIKTPEQRLFRLRIQEQGVRSRSWWEQQVADAERSSSWAIGRRNREPPTGPYDAKATGKLKIHLDGGHPRPTRWRQSNWTDGRLGPLEKRLGEIFAEIDTRIVEAPQREEEERFQELQRAEKAQRAAEERERQWHLHVARARKRLLHAHRATQLRAQAEAWREAQRLRAYCDAVQDAHGSNEETQQWVVWSRAFIEQLNPLTAPPTMPEDPKVETADLAPHMPPGWSPYGPHRGQRSPWR